MLRVDSERRGRSKSPGRRDRERSRSNVRAKSPAPVNNVLQYQEPPEMPDSKNYAYQESQANYANPGSYVTSSRSNEPQYQYAQTPTSPHGESRHLSMSGHGTLSLDMGGSPGAQYANPSAQYAQPNQVQYAQQGQAQYAQPQAQYAQQGHHNSVSGPSQAYYAPDGQYQYHTPDQRITYKYKQDQPQIIDVNPGHNHRQHAGSLSLAPGGMPGGLHNQMGGLSLGMPPMGGMPGAYGAPPGSPLLESYHGTYQQLSPMPSPMMLASHGSHTQRLDDLSPLSSEASSSSSEDSDDSARIARRHSHKSSSKKKGSKFWDPEKDSKKLANALKDKKEIDEDVLIKVLPKLSHEQILALREEYKKYAKYQGKGINITKQIKTYLPPGAFNKACYTTALGRWESEAYWANFWYQGGGSKNELLIEALMGRTNQEIALIKEGFSDKRYNDSLEKCMRAELKANKFRTCVLLALEERRQDERALLQVHEVRSDVEALRKAVTAKEGGETAMINIIVRRSDNHLREVLRVYEQNFKKGFTREMLAKSNNLVGETLTHILNGALNKAMRDAMLLNQCLDSKHALSSSKDKEGSKLDLLVSRLVRLHWDRLHLERVKIEYQRRYGKGLAMAVQEATRGEAGEYLVALCVRR